MAHTHSHRTDNSRDRILHAAIREFSEHGLAGARTSAIATSARVNKALLYYYFRDKEALYAAALEEVAGKVAGDALAVMLQPTRQQLHQPRPPVRRIHLRQSRQSQQPYDRQQREPFLCWPRPLQGKLLHHGCRGCLQGTPVYPPRFRPINKPASLATGNGDGCPVPHI